MNDENDEVKSKAGDWFKDGVDWHFYKYDLPTPTFEPLTISDDIKVTDIDKKRITDGFYKRIFEMSKFEIGKISVETDDAPEFDWSKYETGANKKGKKETKNKPKVNKPIEKEEVEIFGNKYDANNFWIGDYYVAKEHVNVVKVCANVIANGGHLNILALGEAGSGKTSFASALSTFLNTSYTFVDCTTKRAPNEWFGQRSANNGNTYFEKTDFANEIVSGNRLVHYDEINRTRQENRGPLLGLLSHLRSCKIMNETFNIGSGTIQYATANVGYEYAVTGFDKAEYDRFNIYMQFESMTKDLEKKVLLKNGADDNIATIVSDVMDKIRSAVIERNIESTIPFGLTFRRSMSVVQLINYGMDVKEAFSMSLLNGMDKEERQNFNSIISGVLVDNI